MQSTERTGVNVLYGQKNGKSQLFILEGVDARRQIG